jgi:hypothetical protein
MDRGTEGFTGPADGRGTMTAGARYWAGGCGAGQESRAAGRATACGWAIPRPTGARERPAGALGRACTSAGWGQRALGAGPAGAQGQTDGCAVWGERLREARPVDARGGPC